MFYTLMRIFVYTIVLRVAVVDKMRVHQEGENILDGKKCFLQQLVFDVRTKYTVNAAGIRRSNQVNQMQALKISEHSHGRET
jgi:hypothetical protein